MTVDATEARVAHAGEVARRLADAASSRATDVGGDMSHSGRVVGCHSNGAAVDGCEENTQTLFFFFFLLFLSFFTFLPTEQRAAPLTLTRRRLAALSEPLTGFPLVVFGAGAVEVLVDAVTLGLVLTWVWITGV